MCLLVAGQLSRHFFHVADDFLLINHFLLQRVASKSNIPSLVHSVLACLRHTPLQHSPKTAYSLMSGRRLMPPLTENCRCDSLSKVVVISLIPMRTTMGPKPSRTPGGKIILVNINYRISAYGFLLSEKVRSNCNLNAGLLDQHFNRFRSISHW
jgi:hypothetical protein